MMEAGLDVGFWVEMYLGVFVVYKGTHPCQKASLRENPSLGKRGTLRKQDFKTVGLVGVICSLKYC